MFRSCGNLAFGEYTSACHRLASGRMLFAGYANPIPLRLRSRSRFDSGVPKKPTARVGFFSLRCNRNFAFGEYTCARRW